MIGPVKQERISSNPPVYIYHDLITVRQSNILININTMKEVSRSQTRICAWSSSFARQFLPIQLERMVREAPHGASSDTLSRDEDTLLIYMDKLLEILIGAKENYLRKVSWEVK